jgi:hypothetical protein
MYLRSRTLSPDLTNACVKEQYLVSQSDVVDSAIKAVKVVWASPRTLRHAQVSRRRRRRRKSRGCFLLYIHHHHCLRSHSSSFHNYIAAPTTICFASSHRLTMPDVRPYPSLSARRVIDAHIDQTPDQARYRAARLVS